MVYKSFKSYLCCCCMASGSWIPHPEQSVLPKPHPPTRPRICHSDNPAYGWNDTATSVHRCFMNSSYKISLFIWENVSSKIYCQVMGSWRQSPFLYSSDINKLTYTIVNSLLTFLNYSIYSLGLSTNRTHLKLMQNFVSIYNNLFR